MAKQKKAHKSPAIKPRTTETMPIPRLAILLHEAAARCGGYKNLADRMLGPDQKTAVVDRRTLSRIYHGSDVSLKLSQLAVLDDALTDLGVGRLLEGPKLLDALAERGKVTFLLGTYPRKDEKRNDLSIWDVTSANTLMRGISRARAGVQFDIESALPVSCSTNNHDEAARLKKVLAPDGPSVIALGSPKACLATEIMLANFFRIPSFKAPNVPLPFCFYWPDHDFVPSAFAQPFNDTTIQDLTLEATPSSHQVVEHWGLRVGNHLYLENRSYMEGRQKVPVTERRKSYGFVAAQRQPNGQVHACIAGLTGPSSLALSEAMITELAIRPIPNASHAQEPAPVWWVALEVDIQTNEHIAIGENRIMGSRRIIGTSHPLRSET